MTSASSPLPAEAYPLEIHLRAVRAVLANYHYRFDSEVQLHEGMAQALSAAGIAFEHEKRVGPTARFDFWCPDSGLVIEAKIDGSIAKALRQADRYVQLPECRGVLIAAAKAWATGQPDRLLRDKPLSFVRLRSQAF